MIEDAMTDREVEILAHISRKSHVSQRELSKTMDMSLGLINYTLKKFLQGGYLQITQLNKRKVQYCLTTAGFRETAKKVHRSTNETIQNYKKIKSRLASLLQELYTSGYDYFSIEGDGELRGLLESIFREVFEEAPVTLGEAHHSHPRAVVLNITLESMGEGFEGDVVNILNKITQ